MLRMTIKLKHKKWTFIYTNLLQNQCASFFEKRNAPWSDIIFKAKQDLREMTNLENLVDQSNVNIKYLLCKNYFFSVRVKISQSKKIYFLNNYD